MTRLTESMIHTKRLERLLETNRTLTSTRELKPLLDTIVDVACELTDSGAASLLLYDPSIQELRFEASPDMERSGLGDISVPLEGSVAGEVFTSGKTLVIQDASTDSRIFRHVDKKLKLQTRSIIGSPLILQDETIGVLEALNKRGQRNYTEDDVMVLETLAAQAAIAIDNARLMQNLQHANEDLQRLDKMKSDFMAIASHELRTPLGLILGHSTFLREIIPPKYTEQMDVVIRSAMRLKAIIEDMSTISHQEQGKSVVRRMPFSLSELIEESVSRFEEEAKKKKIELGYDIPSSDALMVEGDREKIDVALTNLIRNAITFTDPGGQVGVKAEGDGGYVKVFVVDTGIGIPDADIDRVFERFYQVESHLTRKHGGMGLGLSIAKAMVEMHQGQIWCESKEGTGSLFCFTLPDSSKRAKAASRVFING